MNQHLLVKYILCLYIAAAFVASASSSSLASAAETGSAISEKPQFSSSLGSFSRDFDEPSNYVSNLRSENVKETVEYVEEAVNALEDTLMNVKDGVAVVRAKISTSTEVQVIRTLLLIVNGSLHNQSTKFIEGIATLRDQKAELKEDIAKATKLMSMLQTLLEPRKNVVVFECFCTIASTTGL